MNKPTLVVIVPCYNDSEILNTTFDELSKVVGDLKSKNKISEGSYLSFVDDGSTDETWNVIQTLDVKGLKLSKNFGHQSALIAGMFENDADIFITVDDDLQDDITLIEKMVDKYKEGFEIVYGVRNDRTSDSFINRFFANMYYGLNKILKMGTIPHHADFRLMSKKVIEVLKNYPETNLYLRGLISNLGFKTTSLYYKRSKRVGGKSHYNFLRRIKLALDGITSFSVTPLRFISVLGLLCFIFAILMTIYAFYYYVTTKAPVSGWTSLFISLYFIGGIQLLSIGILGEYIGKIYKESKHRPRYIVEEKSNK